MNFSSDNRLPRVSHHASTRLSKHWITYTDGSAIQHLHYLPFGEEQIDQRLTSFNSRYTFSAKEKDIETNYSYFGARYYTSDLSIWLSVDPMSDKYPSLTPYNYCTNNPVILVDPNGEEGIIYLVDLQTDNKVDTKKLIAETNKRFEEMGLETRMQLAPDGKDFNPNYMDKTDAMAVLGSTGQVKKFINSKCSENNAKLFNDWAGGIDNPERSTNPNKDATMNVIGLDANAISTGAGRLGASQSFYGAATVIHGLGHTAGMGHSDENYNGSINNEQIPQNAMGMCSGRFFQYSASITNALGKGNNGYYIKKIQGTYGTTRSDNYTRNRNAANRKCILY